MMERLVCLVCKKENVEWDYQCKGCGNILDEKFGIIRVEFITPPPRDHKPTETALGQDTIQGGLSEWRLRDRGILVRLSVQRVRELKDNSAYECDYNTLIITRRHSAPVIRIRKKLFKNDIGHRKVYSTGHRPSKGTYICINCNEDLVLDDKSDKLPPCARCHATKFVRERTR